MQSLSILVIGCGVSGLTCGIRLLEAGYAVTILARDLPPHTTSNVAPAIWYPYKAEPRQRVLPWSQVALDEFYRLMGETESGISEITLLETFDQIMPDPWWWAMVRTFRRAAPDELPSGAVDGFVVQMPLIDTSRYMPYLQARYLSLGGHIRQQTIERLSDLYTESRLIVNCAGVGAHQLVPDARVYPLRGQTIRVRAPHLRRYLMVETSVGGLTHVTPRYADVVLGGTVDAGNWNREVDPAIAADIWRRCLTLEPQLEGAEILEHAVGLRPGRDEVRLEVETDGLDQTVIHNYGHGGAGFTLSWGCAAEVVELARRYLTPSPVGEGL